MSPYQLLEDRVGISDLGNGQVKGLIEGFEEGLAVGDFGQFLHCDYAYLFPYLLLVFLQQCQFGVNVDEGRVFNAFGIHVGRCMCLHFE